MINLLETSAAYCRTDPAPALTLTWEEIWNRLTLVAMNLCVRKVQCLQESPKVYHLYQTVHVVTFLLPLGLWCAKAFKKIYLRS